LNTPFARFGSEEEVAAIFDRARGGETVSREEKEVFATAIMLLTGRLNAEKGWTLQLHLGALRNTNSRRFAELGPDTGFDSIGDWSHAEALARFFDALDRDHHLPKAILYNVNPNDNYIFAGMAGNFQDGSVPGKIQFGSGWWYLDQREGMRWQINALSNVGLLRHFVGMLTDSRSFLSFPRHEYFRRVLCDLLGDDVEAGEIPDDFDLLADLVRGISYENAATYFGFSSTGI
jgi:glucuronate isomerase